MQARTQVDLSEPEHFTRTKPTRYSCLILTANFARCLPKLGYSAGLALLELKLFLPVYLSD